MGGGTRSNAIIFLVVELGWSGPHLAGCLGVGARPRGSRTAGGRLEGSRMGACHGEAGCEIELEKISMHE